MLGKFAPIRRLASKIPMWRVLLQCVNPTTAATVDQDDALWPLIGSLEF